MKNYLRKSFLLIAMGIVSLISSNALAAGWPGKCWIIRASTPITTEHTPYGHVLYELGFNQESGEFRMLNDQHFPDGLTFYRAKYIEAWFYDDDDDKWRLHSSNYGPSFSTIFHTDPATTMPHWVDGFSTKMTCGNLPDNFGPPDKCEISQ